MFQSTWQCGSRRRCDDLCRLRPDASSDHSVNVGNLVCSTGAVHAGTRPLLLQSWIHGRRNNVSRSMSHLRCKTIVLCERVASDLSQNRKLTPVFWRSTFIWCKRVPSDVAKSKFYYSFWRSTLIFMRKKHHLEFSVCKGFVCKKKCSVCKRTCVKVV